MTVSIDFDSLGQFMGTSKHFRHWAVGPNVFRYTDGIQHVGARGLGWLLDLIALAQLKQKVRAEPFQTWTLRVELADHTAVLELSDGNQNVIETTPIDYTDFPLSEFVIFVDGGTAMLPSEY